jgi:hypothetical protein
MNDWVLKHPVRAVLIFATTGLAGLLLAVAAAYVMIAAHVLSPDNPVAGALMGFGGVVLGFMAGLMLLGRKR